MTSSQHADAAGTATPEPGNERPDGVGVRGSESHYITPEGEVDATASVAAAQVAERERIADHDKRLATCRARAALRGITMHQLPGEIVFSRGALTKSVETLDEAERWLDFTGCPR